MHASAFGKVLGAVGASNLPAFYANSLKSLWLVDSAGSFFMAVVFAWIAFRPVAAVGIIVVLLSLIPAATGVLLLIFIGRFFPAYMFLVSALLSFIAGVALSNG